MEKLFCIVNLIGISISWMDIMVYRKSISWCMVRGMMAVIGWWDLLLHQTVKQTVAGFKFSYNLDNKFQRKMQLVNYGR